MASPAARILALALVHVALVAPLHAATFTVGSDGACTHTDLQLALLSSALNGPDEDVIRVARNTTYEGQYLIDNQSVNIYGGFDDCSDITASGTTVIDRAAGERNFEVRGTTNPDRTIVFDSLDITFTGLASGSQVEGGAIHLSDGHDLWLLRSNVSWGEAVDGGGIFVDGSTFNVATSTITNNTATSNGGGVACVNGGTVDLISGAVAVNQATFGGGISLENGCEMLSTAGGGLDGVYQNTASSSGGGIFAITGAVVYVVGVATNPAFLGDNDAMWGGGIALTGSTTSANFFDAIVTGNEAVLEGGGIWAGNSASLHVDRTFSTTCHDPVRCLVLSNNVAGSGAGDGGAVWIGAGVTAEIRQTFFESNEASRGVAVFVDDSALTLETSVFAQNMGDSLVHLRGSGTPSLDAAYLTVGDNNGSAFFSLYDDLAPADVNVLSSIVWDPVGPAGVFGTLLGGGPAHTWDCLLVENVAGLGAGEDVVVADPLWTDAAAGDFSLQPSSPAIDFCDNAETSSITVDMVNAPTGVDAPNANLVGPFDLGAFENAFGVFMDGFESGDTGGWSSVVP